MLQKHWSYEQVQLLSRGTLRERERERGMEQESMMISEKVAKRRESYGCLSRTNVGLNIQ